MLAISTSSELHVTYTLTKRSTRWFVKKDSFAKVTHMYWHRPTLSRWIDHCMASGHLKIKKGLILYLYWPLGVTLLHGCTESILMMNKMGGVGLFINPISDPS